jgi:trk system potassium uptake protein TrkA
VAIIDRRAEAFARLGPDFRGTIIQGIGFDRDRLIEAGIEEASAVAAVTNGDNSNVLVARVARENFGIERVVARIYDPRRAAIYQRLGLTTVATVAWTTDQVLRRLLPSSTPPEWIDPTASVCVMERTVPNGWAGHPLTDLEEVTGARAVGVGRLGRALVPTARTVAQQGDLLYLAVSTEAVDRLDAALAAGPGGRH